MSTKNSSVRWLYLVLGTGTPLALIQIGHIAAQIYYEARC